MGRVDYILRYLRVRTSIYEFRIDTIQPLISRILGNVDINRLDQGTETKSWVELNVLTWVCSPKPITVVLNLGSTLY